MVKIFFQKTLKKSVKKKMLKNVEKKSEKKIKIFSLFLFSIFFEKKMSEKYIFQLKQ